ncbi:MAG: glutamate--tRNA ligase [bacterium]|nr:glutamate--tRNA ligase [bacterium]
MSKVRVRFTPSPVGYLHVSNARIALINYLFARKHKGELLLRIEDCGKDRMTDEAFEQVTKDLRWLKIEWEEGPNKGGPYGPYRQSLRGKIYTERLNYLIEKKLVYPCYATQKELEQLYADQRQRGEKVHYDNRARNLSEAEKLEYENQGRKPVWRFKVEPQKIVFHDMLLGMMTFDTFEMNDFVVMNADHTPSPIFAITVDDAQMKISHVLWEQNHLQHIPAHILLFNALGYHIPQYGHFEMMYGVDSQPLYKQDLCDIYSCSHLRRNGFLPESIHNYLLLFGKDTLSSTTHKLDDFIEGFTVSPSTKTYVTFDPEALKKINRCCIQSADLIRIADLTLPYLKENKMISSNLAQGDYEYIIKVIDLIRNQVDSLAEINDYAGIFFFDYVALPNALTQKLSESLNQNILRAIDKVLDEEKDLVEVNVPFDEFCSRIVELTQADQGMIQSVLRWVLTGLEHGPELQNSTNYCQKKK